MSFVTFCTGVSLFFTACGYRKSICPLGNPLQFGSFSNLEVLGQFPITFEFTRTTSQVRVRFKNIVLISFDCDSCFHDDVPVVNSKIILSNGLVWDLDRSITGVIRATIRSLLFKDMTSHSIYKFSWKNVTSICIKREKRSHFHDTPSEKTDVNSRSRHSRTILLRPKGTAKTSFNRTYFLHWQNVWRHVVFQYFSRKRTCTRGFEVKIISRVLEVFCLSWAHLCQETVVKGTLQKLWR